VAYTARDLVDQARSRAYLQETKFISYKDEVDLINEAYRDIYNRYVESSADYFVREFVITPDATMLDPNGLGRGWLIPVPENFYKLRAIDWASGGEWIPVQSFSMSQRDNNGGNPQYRLINDSIWIISSFVATLKIKYCIPPVPVSLPAEPIQYFPNVPESQVQAVSSLSYIDKNETLLYVDGSTGIKSQQSVGNFVVNALLTTAGAVTNLQYYKGYLYWVQALGISRVATDLVTPIIAVPTVVFPAGNVTALNVLNNKLYFVDGASSKSAALDGSGVVTIAAEVRKWTCLYQSVLAWVSPTNLIVVNGVALATFGAVTGLASDGEFLYATNAAQELVKVTFDIPTGLVTASVVVAEQVAPIDQGNSLVSGKRLALASGSLMAELVYGALSVNENTEFLFPQNEVNEIMIYESAIKFLQKANKVERIPELEKILIGMWGRFDSVNKRDEYQFYRINDDYNNSNGFGFGSN
jgi:hypothetical protein